MRLIWLSTFRGKVHSRGVGVQVKAADGKDVTLYEGSYALVIGVSAYTKGWPVLPGVKTDVAEVSEALRNQGFQVETVKDPTSETLEREIKSFISKYGQTPANRLLIYFAGHGETVTTADGRKLGYIIPKDAPLYSTNPGTFKQTAISMDEVEVYALQIEAKHALFVFDSCFGGALFQPSRSAPPAITIRTGQPVRQFITAGTAEQEVPDHSIFREQFVEALKGSADMNGDGYITGSELGMYLEDTVSNYTKGAQTPPWGKIRNPSLDKGDFVFVLPEPSLRQAVSSAPVTKPTPLDPKLIELTYWESIKDSKNPEDFKAYLEAYPGRTHLNL
jgi:uncharacterized caspase-like protein